jgi:hypothetical protein
MIQRLKVIIPVLIFIFLHVAESQILTTSRDSIERAANPNLQASGFHRFLFGSEWRDAWSTPLHGEILKADSTLVDMGIISPTPRTHNGTISRSYLCKGKDGQAYSFTPLIQDSASSLPAELAALLPRKIVDDQIGTLNPFAPIIASEIQRAVGLPYRETQLVSLSAPSNSGKYHTSEIGILEGPWCLPCSSRIDSLSDPLAETPQMLKSITSSVHHRVDELQYLKSRLVDILLGDWDRSPDQWQWFKKETSTGIVWIPVPSHHQQAFVRLNGVLPTIADMALPHLEDCGEKISSVENLTLTARMLDRKILISYPKQTWDSLAIWIQTHVSDSVIMKAISHPSVSFSQEDKISLIRMLQSRRLKLLKGAEEFYKLSSAFVEICLSDNADRVDIRRIGRHMVSLAYSDRLDTLHKPLYQRLFHDDYTKEIRILLLDGDDVALLEGEENSTIKIIIDGGDGTNELVDKSKSRSLFASMGLFAASETIFYDHNPASRLRTGGTTNVVREQQNLSSEKSKTQKTFVQRDWGSEWSFSPWLDINPDDGLFIGGGPSYTQYAYRMDPYAEQLGIRAGLATRTGRYRLDATGEFRDLFRGIRVFIQLHASQLDLASFYGLGNETSYSQSLDDAGFYKVDQQQLFIHTALDFPLSTRLFISFSGKLKLIDNNPQPNTLLYQLFLPYYRNTLTFLSVSGKLQYDTRDNKSAAQEGKYLAAECTYAPAVIDLNSNFIRLRLDARAFFTLAQRSFLVLALRCKAENIWGEHPFFESAFLGGNESLRGFERQRFAGDASVLGGMELRGRVAKIPFLVPLWIGVSGFAETGRVFHTSEESQRWHTVVGGGLWFSFIKPDYIANFSLARSEDKFAFYATLGFMF